MNAILDQLLSISGRLECPSGVSPSELANLRTFLAASLIQDNPGALPIQPDATIDRAFNEAAAKGAILATKLAETATRIRVVRDSYASPIATPDDPARILGPFGDADGSLVQFAVFESTAFFTVQLSLPLPSPIFTELLMFLPPETSSNDGNQTFTIPQGTVWLRARLVVANTPGYVGLRVNKGEFRIDGVAQQIAVNRIAVPVTTSWSLRLDPGQPIAPDGNGSDANNLALQLPRRLEVRSTGETRVNGAIRISGFGSELEFNEALIPPQATPDSIVFPYETQDAPWSINGNLSAVARFTGETRVISAGWSLPLNKLPLNTFGDLPHGGRLKLRLREGLESRLVGAAGSFTWFDTTLTASAEGVSLETRQAESSARSELDLWTKSHTETVFAQQSIGRVFYSSFHNRHDVALVSGGE
ncbi:MAG: hypothetical protein L0Z53_18735, partial [Acidobacteriales bacterium]|nr:hypothetical protein [Terriglobales bacterium]